jgi:hypothetical protein
MQEISYQYPRFERLQPRSEWRGGRLADTDLLTLEEAAGFASKHAGEEITARDFLRAAGRGEITLRAIVHRAARVRKHDGGVLFNKGEPNENIVPAGAIPTLPLSACQHLANAGRASWRTFDGFDERNGILMRYTKGMLADDEPDFETVPADCRVVGYDVHALADEYTAPESTQAEPQAAAPAPVAGLATNSATPDPERRLARLRALGGDAIYRRGEWKITGISALVASEKGEGRKRCDEKTIRADLKEAAESEREAKRANAFSGLGQR